MELSLAFHMIFAAAGVAMPVLMLVAEGPGCTPPFRATETWPAPGARRPRCSSPLAPYPGPPCRSSWGCCGRSSWRSPACSDRSRVRSGGLRLLRGGHWIGLYLYGWQRLNPLAHWLAVSIGVALSGAASAVLVVSANAWMQHPVGFELAAGRPTTVDPGRLARSIPPGHSWRCILRSPVMRQSASLWRASMPGPCCTGRGDRARTTSRRW